ncbi:MAG: redoxin domain-containing protein [Planctomycetaceae bacterium]|nr:redoxin domain-containing protein [Planctomycetaceae bacterium]
MGRFVLALCAAVASSTTTVADTPLEQMKLQTYRGQDWSLAEAADKELVVLAFLGTECPLAKLYGPRLQDLHQEFGEKVAFVGVNSNKQDSVTEIGFYVEAAGIRFPVLKDVGNRLADRLEAERTPEVIVLDTAQNVVYRGRIDDQYAPGLSASTFRRRDLAEALAERLSGKSVSVPTTKAVGCYIGRLKKSKPLGEITYTKHIAPIINANCLECHRSGQIAPFSLASYEDIQGWEETILEVIDQGRMPPWYADPQHGTFSNDARLSDTDKRLLQTWVSNGMPKGDPADLPTPPQFADGWRLEGREEDIDVIHVYKSDEDAFEVPAEGIVDYQYFEVDPGWTEDKYVVAAEARPDNTSVVHHIIAYIIEPGDKKRRRRRMLVGYAPGSLPQVLDEGTAIRVKAGSKLLFEMHYTPNGSPQKDRSYIGLKYTDKKNVKKTLNGWAVANTEFTIPAGEANYRVPEAITVPVDQMLLELTPHMHLRGKAFQYTLIRTDGTKETLLNVPNYDFNWQLSYKLAEPILLKKGDRILCEAWYDNSRGNRALADLNKEIPTDEQASHELPVSWGDQSFQEMMIGFLTTVDP